MGRHFTAANSEFISVGNSASLNPASITVAAWIYIDSYTAEEAVIARDDDTLGRAYELRIVNSVQDVSFAINGAVAIAATGPGLGVWLHVAGVGNSASGYSLYINGVLSAGPSFSGTAMGTTTGNTTIGERTYSSSHVFFDGRIADAAIWNTILSGANIAALASGARPKDVNSANLVGWWPLGCSLVGGQEPDLSGSGFNGTLTGTTITASPNQIRRGARATTGQDTDYVDLGSSSTLNPTTAMSFACWVNAISFPHAYNVIIKRINGGGTAYYALQPKSTGKMALFYVDAGATPRGYDGTGLNTLVAGVWYHVGFVLPSGATAGVGYVNGANDSGGGAGGGGVAAITGNTLISRDASTANSGWNGQIADVAIWNTALAAGDFANLYAGVRPINVNSANLVGWWPLDSNGATETDRSSGANNGTVTGTTSWLGPPYTWRIG